MNKQEIKISQNLDEKKINQPRKFQKLQQRRTAQIMQPIEVDQQTEIDIQNQYLKNYKPQINVQKIELKDQIDERQAMADWMIEVLSQLNIFEDCLYFRILSIMDRFLEKSQENYDIFIVGIASIILGTKIEKNEKFHMSIWVEQVGHNYFNEDQILEMEEIILNQLNFEFQQSSLYDLLIAKIYLNQENLFLKNDQEIKKFIDQCSQILKICIQNSIILKQESNETISIIIELIKNQKDKQILSKQQQLLTIIKNQINMFNRSTNQFQAIKQFQFNKINI